jgi:hypothetical protein
MQETLETYAAYGEHPVTHAPQLTNVIQDSFRMTAGVPFGAQLRYEYLEPTYSGRQWWVLLCEVSGRFEDKRYGLPFMVPEPGGFLTLFGFCAPLLARRRCI